MTKLKVPITTKNRLVEIHTNPSDFPDMFEYEVNPENQCQGLKIWAKEQGHNRFEGFVQYSDYFKEFYLTIDGITYTSLKDAFNIKPVIS